MPQTQLRPFQEAPVQLLNVLVEVQPNAPDDLPGGLVGFARERDFFLNYGA